jgi:hypothetical protein
MPEGSMRSDVLFYRLIILVLFTVLFCMPVLADAEIHEPTLIIPTKFRYLLMDMVRVVEGQASSGPVPAPVQTPVPTPAPTEKPTTLSASEDSGSDEEALLAGLTPDQSYSGFGRGFVQTNFDVSFAQPDGTVSNHERMTARGLFDVHVSHGFN